MDIGFIENVGVLFDGHGEVAGQLTSIFCQSLSRGSSWQDTREGRTTTTSRV